ncbi:hypothetical protein GLOIN_2v1768728 [Rhizophagus irregularis DAOM 181602=DAOM 197198]|nr:hypothetical protein GLOIN_2v1768728 [Rhizophagus irregularis DAOM 181602=DAOM 197198]
MRPRSFYLLTAIFMFFYMTFAPVIEAYSVGVYLDMNAGACRIWIEDSNHKRIAGDGKGDYHACDGTSGNRKSEVLSMAIPVFVYMEILESFILINITVHDLNCYYVIKLLSHRIVIIKCSVHSKNQKITLLKFNN